MSKRPEDTPNLIAMYGGTGVGKSTFINDATGRLNMPVGHDLNSQTREVAASEPFILDGQKVVLFDTPGFDDTTISDADTLKQLASFLESMYRKGMKLKGLVYLHRISDNRIGGASARIFRLLRTLCGTENLSNVVIVLQMWTEPPTEEELRREEQLKSEFFKSALDNGAHIVRRMSPGTKSAHDILRTLLPKRAFVSPLALDMVDKHIPLSETEAGQIVAAGIQNRLDEQETELRELREEISTLLAESDTRIRKQLEQYRQKKENEMAALRHQIASLGIELEEGKRFWEQQFDDLRVKRGLADEQGEAY